MTTTQFYAVSGYVNAETLHVFNTAAERDTFVEQKQNDTNAHYTLAKCKKATKKEAIAHMGGQRNFDDAVNFAKH